MSDLEARITERLAAEDMAVTNLGEVLCRLGRDEPVFLRGEARHLDSIRRIINDERKAA